MTGRLPQFWSSIPALDITQGGFGLSRGALDQAFALNHLIWEFRHRHGSLSALAFLGRCAPSLCRHTTSPAAGHDPLPRSPSGPLLAFHACQKAAAKFPPTPNHRLCMATPDH
ncbi:hypothetical protein BCR43DRAFT_489840 [Syncephalastrum racemosum]|uniref:Uncharacterized protein n=1 Tax=Syncephalastrum racemosum TaxID=13706 RepID=A0A1X2HEZ2_SYNRA|nr:hypothetical protein BCR43DRAFT_489840 [Syncephalastrum racemosum]